MLNNLTTKPFSLISIIYLTILLILPGYGYSQNLEKAKPKLDANPTLQGSVQKSMKSNTLKNSLLQKINKKPLTDSLTNEMLQNSASRSVGVIGVLFQIRTGSLPLIKYVFPNTPAQKAGLKVGDYIVAVDGTPIAGYTREEIYGSIIGVPNTPVNISVKRGDSFFVKKIMRIDVTDIPDYETRSKYMREL